MVVLQDGDRTLGWLSIDNALHHRPLTPMQREVLSLYGRTLSSIIQHKQFRALNEKYRAQNDLKDRLFTILAHDLRGPIGNIGVMLGMAVDTPMDAEDLKEILVESRQAALRTYNLLDNVLGWVRSQIAEVSALRERIPVYRPLKSVQAWLLATAKAKGITLEVDCHESLTVLTDERMVETILRNLVSNAVKYSPKGQKVTLRGRTHEGFMLLEVVDRGVGLPADKLNALFTSRQKVSQPGTTGEGGNGLGLMFSSDLTRTLGGRLEAESVDGQGSTFRLVLPDELDGDL
jgi:signal transduction histidine kinase